MQFYTSDDTAARIGETIGTIIAAIVIVGLIWITGLGIGLFR